ncbi:transcription initiation factor TFIID subunit 4b isoform X2 [Arachis ipaensis]|uniref:transcription initiation factor TFIID subunit 4b isoform X2 n=1 Tax=Arachis ipaensis TaxID=130454 RepID=UPI000A2B1B03|nr:transcription initiation factor TFIID subunit 4b isoform X2 [Arachis ipaensis]
MLTASACSSCFFYCLFRNQTLFMPVLRWEQLKVRSGVACSIENHQHNELVIEAVIIITDWDFFFYLRVGIGIAIAMDPSIMKLLEDDEDETMHSGVDVEAFQAALNRDIGGSASTSGSDPVLSQGSNNTLTQSMPHWPTPSHENQTQVQNQEPETAQQREQPSSEVEQKQHGSLAEQVQHVASQDVNNPPLPQHVASLDVNNPPLPQHVGSQSVNNPPLPQHVGSQNVNNPPLPQHVASQNVSNPALSQKQTQDEGHQPQPVQASLQNSQTVGIQNLGKDPAPNNEVAKTLNPSSESQQYAKLQQISNQQATVNEQPGGQINRQKQVPFGMLLPILIPQLPKDRAMQLQTLFSKLKKDEIAKDSFVRLMKGIVGDQMLKLAWSKVQAQLQAQTRPNQGPVGQQQPVRMPTVGLGARQLNDPHALAQLHQRSMNAAADQSRMTSSAVQTMENNARKSQELDARMETQDLQPSQLSSSNSITVSQEAERLSVHVHGLNKQPQPQHLHFPSAYGSSGGNYRPFSGPASSSASSIRPPPHVSHMSQIPHQSTGPNHLGGATHGFIGMPKLEQQNSLNDPKSLPGGSVALLNNSASQQTPNAWQPPSNKDQNSGFLSSGSYVKKEPSDMPTEQQHRQNISKIHGLPSANFAQIEQASANQGTMKDEFSRGLPVSTSMAPTSTGLTSLNSASPSGMAQLDPSVSVSTQVPSNTSGITVRAPVKKPSVGQKKPLEALGSSPPPPPSKKQKGSGGSVEQSIDQLNDVTAVSGVDLREEEEQLFSGPKEDSRVLEATRRAVQEEEERLILQKIPLQKKMFEIMFKYGLKGVSNDVERCLSLCVEERMRGLISNLIRMSKQRVDFEKTRHWTVVTSDVQQQIMTINRKVREEWEKRQAEAEKLRKQNDVDGNAGADGDKDKDEGRNKSSKVNKEEDDKMRTNAANVAARAAVGGDDMLSKWQLMAEQARQKREGMRDTSSGSQPAKDVSCKSSASGKSTKDNHEGDKKGSTNFVTSGAIRKHGRNNSLVTQTKIARSISVKDVIAVLEIEPQMSKSSLIHCLYEKIHSDAQPE